MTDAHDRRMTAGGLDRLGYAATASSVAALRVDAEGARDVTETLAEEIPITIAYNGVAHAVMMATPQDLDDFAIGFSFTEGLALPHELLRTSIVRHGRAIELQLEVAEEVAIRAGPASRRLSGRTGCGLCGAADVERVLRTLPVVASTRQIHATAIARALRDLEQQQPLNAATGAVHAAGWARADGELAFVREDVGRHNALDKVVGAVLRAGDAAGEGFVVVTSRGSFELVQKAALLGVPLLATVSAPTALAVRVAVDAGVALAGFARDGRITLYSHRDRVVHP